MSSTPLTRGYYQILEDIFPNAGGEASDLDWTPDRHRRLLEELEEWYTEAGAEPEGDFQPPRDRDANLLVGPTPDFDFVAGANLQGLLWDMSFHMEVFLHRRTRVPRSSDQQQLRAMQEFLHSQFQIRPHVEAGIVDILPHVEAWPTFDAATAEREALEEHSRRAASGDERPVNPFKWVATGAHALEQTGAQFWTNHPDAWDAYRNWGGRGGDAGPGGGGSANGGDGTDTDPSGGMLLFDAFASVGEGDVVADLRAIDPENIRIRRRELADFRTAVQRYREEVRLAIEQEPELKPDERYRQLRDIAEKRLTDQLRQMRRHDKLRRASHGFAVLPIALSMITPAPVIGETIDHAVGIGAGVLTLAAHWSATKLQSTPIQDNLFWNIRRLS